MEDAILGERKLEIDSLPISTAEVGCPHKSMGRTKRARILQRAPRRCPGGPGPLKVKASELPRNVNDFPDEIQAGDFAAFHGLGRKFVSIDAANRDFGFFVAFGSGGDDLPEVDMFFQVIERIIRP